MSDKCGACGTKSFWSPTLNLCEECYKAGCQWAAKMARRGAVVLTRAGRTTHAPEFGAPPSGAKPEPENLLPTGSHAPRPFTSRDTYAITKPEPAMSGVASSESDPRIKSTLPGPEKPKDHIGEPNDMMGAKPIDFPRCRDCGSCAWMPKGSDGIWTCVCGREERLWKPEPEKPKDYQRGFADALEAAAMKADASGSPNDPWREAREHIARDIRALKPGEANP